MAKTKVDRKSYTVRVKEQVVDKAVEIAGEYLPFSLLVEMLLNEYVKNNSKGDINE